MTKPDVTVTRIGGFGPREFFAVVDGPTFIGDVLVTYNARTRQPWRCQTHGRHLWAECIHEKAAQARAREEWK